MRRSIGISALLFITTACGDDTVALATGSSGMASAEATDSAEATGAPPTSMEPTTTLPGDDMSTSAGATGEDSTGEDTGAPVDVCLDHGLTLNEPEDFAVFAGFNCVDGDVRVYPGSGPDLAGLAVLRKVSGSVSVEYDILDGSHELVSLHGLEQLETIGGDFVVESAPNLVDMTALAGLAEVGGDFSLTDVPQLTTLALPHLHSVEELFLTAESLTTLELGALTEVPGRVRLWGTRLATLAAFSGVTALGELWIEGAPQLQDVDGLGQLAHVEETLHIVGCPLLTDLGGLAGLTGPRELYVEDNAALVDIDALAEVTTLERVRLRGNPALLGLHGLAGVTTLVRLEIEDNAGLHDLAGLGGLVAVEGLGIEDNAGPQSLTGLDPEIAVGWLWALRNPQLASLAPLPVVEGAEVRDNAALTELGAWSGPMLHLWISGNPKLAGLDTLAGVTAVTELEVVDNDALTDLHGLEGLTGTALTLTITDNANLVTLDGGGAITSAGAVTIADNPKLGSLALLAGLESVSSLDIQKVAITDVGELSALTQAASVRIVDNPALTAIGGLGALVQADTLIVRDNPKLAALAPLDQGALAAVPEFYWVAQNPLLPTCAAEAALAGLDAPPEYACWAQNKADACSPDAKCDLPPQP